MPHLNTLLLSGVLTLSGLTMQSVDVFADVQNIVLVHGANADGSTWREVYDRLVADDYNVTVAQLPLTSAEDDIAAVRRNLEALDGSVLLVGHSYGGVVITEVGTDPNVKGLVYVAAFQPDEGQSSADLVASVSSDFTPDKLEIFDDGHYLVSIDAFKSLVGNGLSDEDAKFAAQSQAMSNMAILTYEVQVAAWREKPSWTAIATQDRTIAPELQRLMSERAGSTVVEIENGHILPMTSPDAVAQFIRQAAQAVD